MCIRDRFKDGVKHTMEVKVIDDDESEVTIDTLEFQDQTEDIQIPVENLHKPTGRVIFVPSNFTVWGDAIDMDRPDSPLKLKIYVDGVFQVDRSTLETKNSAGRFGYNWWIPTKFKDGVQHTMEVKVIDDNQATILIDSIDFRFE